MTADTTPNSGAAPYDAAGTSAPADDRVDDRPTLLRLTLVELRKLTDTRAGYWLLITIGMVAAAIVAVILIFAPDGDQQFGNLFALAQFPVGILLPILGILLVTSEFSQRTALATFALVPQRHRVVVAKLGAGMVAALLSVLASAATAALGTVIAGLTGEGGSWATGPLAFVGAAAFQMVNAALGIAFGLLFQSTPLAIVLSLVLPIAWSALGGMIEQLHRAAEWLDTGITTAALVEPPNAGELGAGEWARLGVSVAVWVLAPLVGGLVRTLRREVS
ncbi:ABC transporter permease [Plantactinospora sp. WMMC1484]|uniref:ABC transporter permease n=1 Tax=Plantactinospora sp. WMMC1484 TaxID=3404122 RepID=UPI003BF619AD